MKTDYLHRLVRALTRKSWKPVLQKYEAAALCGTHDIESIELAFFNYDSKSEPQPGQWEKRREEWKAFKGYLATHRIVGHELGAALYSEGWERHRSPALRAKRS